MSKQRDMMVKRKLILIAIIIIIVLTGIRFLWFGVNQAPPYAHVERGVLDLRSGNFSAGKTLALNGSWEFYPGQWIQPGRKGQAENKQDYNPQYIRVPGNWGEWSGAESGYGYATYRLHILLDDKEIAYAIKMNNLQTASRIYIDGRLVYEAGRPAQNPEQSVPRVLPDTVTFIPDHEEIELLIHVSNYEFNQGGGMVESIIFGTETAVNAEQHFYSRMQMAVCALLILHVLYAGLISLIGIRNYGLLFMTLAVCFMIVSNFVEGSRLLLQWLPMTQEWALKLGLISNLGAAGCLLLGIRHLIGWDLASSKSWGLVSYLAFAAVMVIPFLPLNILVNIDDFFRFLMLLNILQVLLISCSSLVQQGKSAVFLLFSTVSLASLAFWSVIKYVFWIEMPYYPLDSIFICLGLAAFWFSRYDQTHKRMKRYTEMLRKVDKNKDDYLTYTSLELQNPLEQILELAKSLLHNQGSSMNKKGRTNLELIVKVGQRMSLLLSDLVDIKRLKTQNVNLSPKEVQLAPVINIVFDMLQFMTEGKKVEFVSGVPDHFPAVSADEDRLIQILFNLVHNALKYTNEGLITVYAEWIGSMVHIHVEDSGIGISEELQRRIFLPYEQGDSSLTSQGGGIGLGLSICRQLVELHGGELSVKSSPSQGAVFTFTLPVAHAAPKGSE